MKLWFPHPVLACCGSKKTESHPLEVTDQEGTLVDRGKVVAELLDLRSPPEQQEKYWLHLRSQLEAADCREKKQINASIATLWTGVKLFSFSSLQCENLVLGGGEI